MTRQGSFFPLRRDVATAEPVMFACVLDTPAQREALQEEMLDRIATDAGSDLSGTCRRSRDSKECVAGQCSASRRSVRLQTHRRGIDA